MNADWYKSSYSMPQGENCVECRAEAGRVLIRDSQHPERGHLAVSAAEWRAFVAAVDEL